MLEELGVALAVSAPYCVAVWFAVDLQGSFVLYWLVYVVTTSVATGAGQQCVEGHLAAMGLRCPIRATWQADARGSGSGRCS